MSSRIAKVLSFVRTTSNDAKVNDVEVDIGGGDNSTGQHFSAPGDDSFPLKTDYAIVSDVARSGSKVAHGYLDPLSTPKALEGDKRIYARNPADGSPVNEVWLKNDGSVLVSNDNGSVLLRADGGSIVTTPESTFDCAASGSIKGANASGAFELQVGGTMDINGATIDTSGNIVSPGTIAAATSVSAPTIAAATSVSAPTIAATTNMIAAGKELAGHGHSQGNDSNGDSQVNTSGNL